MKTENWLWAVVEAGLWYGVIYYSLYSLKNPVNLGLSALIIMGLSYLAVLVCPWFRQTDAWKRMRGEK